MTQVFISYSRKDLEFVDRLANDLKATGFEVWYDLSGLEPGTRWRQEIQKAIQESQFFLVVLSPNSIISDWVEREFLFASDQDKKIIPLLYQACTLPMWSLNLHFIDMQGKNYTLHYQDLLKVMGFKTGSEEENPIAIRYIEIGDEYRKRGKAAQAIESYQQAINVEPGNLKAHINIAAVHLSEQAYAEATAAYELALQISNADLVARAGWSDANMALGNQARAEGKLDEAIRFYLEILRVVPEDRDARQSLANIYTSRADNSLNAGQMDEALAAFSEAIKYTPDDQDLTSNLEKLQARKKTSLINELVARSEIENSVGNWEQSLKALQEALKISPQDASLLKKIATIQMKQQQQQLESILSKVDQAEKEERWDAAMAGLKDYLQLKRDDKIIQKRMADLMQSKHAAWLTAVNSRVDQALSNRNWDVALVALNDALQLEPDNKELKTKADQIKKDQGSAILNAIIMRANQASAAGRWDDAIGILNNGLVSYPDNGSLKAKLAETLQARRELQRQSVINLVDAAVNAGKWESALTSLNQVLADEPDNAVFLEKYNQILTLERESKLNALRTRANNLLKEQKFEEALAAWNETLLLDPENRKAILAEIEAINKAQKLETDYSQGLQAFAAKEYQKAVDLFNSVLLEQPGYKDAVKLLAKTRKLLPSARKQLPAGRRVWIIVGMLIILALGIGGLKLLLERDKPTATPTLVAEITGSSTAANQVPTSTPDPRKINPANQHQYQLIDNLYSWQDARDDCVAKGGYLVTIQDAAENQFIYQIISPSSIWLGATDENKDGTWAWVTGEPWMYTNWAEGQPDNDFTEDSSGENYLAFLWPEAPTQWNDEPNGSKRYVCEWEPTFPNSQTLTVVNAEDSGAGSLRQAMLEARAGDIITFDPATFPPDNIVAINLYSALPVIDQGYLTIDGSNAGVVLNGSHVGGEWTAGIDIWSDYNIIKGLGIVYFPGPGIDLQANANFNTIGGDRGIGASQIGEGNFVGANSDGIAILGSDNIITGNLVGILGPEYEDQAVGNRAAGIFIAEKASRNTIGPNNIIAYNGTVEGCGIEYTSLEAKDNNLTANIIYSVKLKSPGICYNINPGGQFVYSTPATVLYFDLESGTAAGKTCPNCIVEIFSTNTQDGKVYEGPVTADEFGNFVFDKNEPLTGPYLTTTARSPGENTSEFSLPTPERTDLMIALDAAWVQKPVYETAFNTWNFVDPDPNAKLEAGELIITSENMGEVLVELNKINTNKYVVEFEILISNADPGGSNCLYRAGRHVQEEPIRMFEITIKADGQASFGYLRAPEDFPEVATFRYDASILSKVKLVLVEDQVAVLMNGQIGFATIIPGASENYLEQKFGGGKMSTCEFDNYKFWDLSGVNYLP